MKSEFKMRAIKDIWLEHCIGINNYGSLPATDWNISSRFLSFLVSVALFSIVLNFGNMTTEVICQVYNSRILDQSEAKIKQTNCRMWQLNYFFSTGTNSNVAFVSSEIYVIIKVHCIQFNIYLTLWNLILIVDDPLREPH